MNNRIPEPQLVTMNPFHIGPVVRSFVRSRL
jgi:hypothetical protein